MVYYECDRGICDGVQRQTLLCLILLKWLKSECILYTPKSPTLFKKCLRIVDLIKLSRQSFDKGNCTSPNLFRQGPWPSSRNEEITEKEKYFKI